MKRYFTLNTSFLGKTDLMNKRDYLERPDKYVYPFIIHEKSRNRTIITYNDAEGFGPVLRQEHTRIASDFLDNFCDRNPYSYAYHKGVSCLEALNDHLKSNHFIKLDIHHFFESITEDLFFKTYSEVFNAKWRELLSCCFYQGHLSIGFVTSPLLSDYFMSRFDRSIEQYLSDKPYLHFSRYSDDMLLSSEGEYLNELNQFYTFVLDELNKLTLTLNEKKTKKITLSYETHNSISFLGLNLSKADDVNNKVTISKAYILFLLNLIKKNNLYNNRCAGLVNEINSRVAYLAYNSPVSFARFQKKHEALFGKRYDFVPKAVSYRVSGKKALDLPNLSSYQASFKFDIHKKEVDSTNNHVINSDSVAIVKYIGHDSVVTIPDFVTSISAKAFEYSSVTQVILNKELRYIGDQAFSGCSHLTSINGPDKLVYLGNDAFRECTSLKEITLGSALKKIGRDAFSKSGLEQVTLGSSLIEIGDRAFEGCYYLKSISLPVSITTLGDAIFKDNYRLKEVNIQSLVTKLPTSIFENCYSLKDVTLPQTLLSLAESAFKQCISLKELTLNSAIVDIPTSALSGCRNLTQIALADNPVYSFNAETHQLVDMQNHSVVFSTDYAPQEGMHILTRSAMAKFTGETYIVPEGITQIETGCFKNHYALKELILPHSLTSLSIEMCANCCNLTKVVIQSDITVIPESCFARCSQLRELILPAHLKRIGKLAFYNDYNLSLQQLPSHLEVIEYKAFELCRKIKDLYIPRSLKSINPLAFLGCSDTLEHISVDEENVVYDSRHDCNALIDTKHCQLILGCKNTVIPTNIKTIGQYAFAFNHSLEALTIPENIKSIEEKAFLECNHLSVVSLKGVYRIGKQVFSKCSSLKVAEVGQELVEMGPEAFSYCRNLQKIILPTTLLTLGTDAFKGCSGVKELVIEDTTVAIDADTFIDLTDLDTITISKNNSVYSDGGTQAIIAGFTLIKGCKNTVIPEYIMWVGAKAFYHNSHLTHMVIPEQVLSIETSAFQGCQELTDITLNQRLNYLGRSVFSDCGLKKLSLPESIDSLPAGMVKNNPYLEEIEILGAISSLYNPIAYNCPSLKNIKVAAGQPLKFDHNMLYTDDTLIRAWGNVTLPSSITKIAYAAFSGDDTLTQITIPHTVESLGGYAFYGCSQLKDVVILGDLTEIPESAFENCSHLESITLPNTLKTIHDKAFKGCGALSHLNLPDALEYIRNEAFAECTQLTQVSLPNSLHYMGSHAFKNVPLTSLTLPESLELISGSSFYGCSATLGHITPNNKYHQDGVLEALVDNGTLILGCKNTVITAPINRIADEAFMGSDITHLDFDLVKSISPKAFTDCVHLDAVHINGAKVESTEFKGAIIKQLEVDEDNPFLMSYHNNLINKVTQEYVSATGDGVIPDGLERLGSFSFSKNSLLSHMVIPASVHSIFQSFAEGCLVDTITVDAHNPVYDSRNNCNAIIFTQSDELIWGCKNTVIPEGIKSIGSTAFTGCSDLTHLTIPSTVKQINLNAFKGCCQLKSITVDSNNKVYYSNDQGTQILSKSTGKVVLDAMRLAHDEPYYNVKEEKITFSTEHSSSSMTSDMNYDDMPF